LLTISVISMHLLYIDFESLKKIKGNLVTLVIEKLIIKKKPLFRCNYKENPHDLDNASHTSFPNSQFLKPFFSPFHQNKLQAQSTPPV
jgi:hypothetical protein